MSKFLRICEQIVDIPVPRVAQKLTDEPKTASQDRIWLRTVVQICGVSGSRQFGETLAARDRREGAPTGRYGAVFRCDSSARYEEPL